ncbi:MAG: DUF86 domain-containing protein [Sphingobacteriaceae bacterium]|nr:MAG: DUF86 domain-containing protein [Sphingobacteriaceae bacterium]
MSGNYKDEVRVKHVLDAINQLVNISANKNFEKLKSDIIYQLASIKLLEIIGEASNHISTSTKDKFPDNPKFESSV